VNPLLSIAMLSIHSSPMGVLGTTDTGGMSVYISEIAREMGARGHIVDIFTRRDNPLQPEVVNLEVNVRLIHLDVNRYGPIQKLDLFHCLKDFFHALNRWLSTQPVRYDLVHSHYWLSGHLGLMAQAKWGLPHMVTFHTLGAVKNATGVGVREPSRRIAGEKQLASGCSRILVAAQREKENLIRHYDTTADKIGVIPCGVNLDRFHPMDPITARNRVDLHRDDALILFVGRFVPLKGINRLLAALPHLTDTRRIQVIMVGGDKRHPPEFNRFKTGLTRRDPEGMIRFVGSIPQPDLVYYYNAANVVVVPSHYESFGLVGLESLACGTPVVTTAVGAMDEVVCHGETGWVLDRADPRELAHGIQQFLPDGPAAGRSTAAVIRNTVSGYDWSRIAGRIIQAYTEMAPGKR
jgi:D-inositol-3-phosphate glycosyltransferase